jgi:hypothetical protein
MKAKKKINLTPAQNVEGRRERDSRSIRVMGRMHQG